MPPITPPRTPATSPESSSIFALCHTLNNLIIQSIDTSLTWEQLNSPPVNYTLIRPIVDRFAPNSEPEKSASPNATLPVPPNDSGESGRSTNGVKVGEEGLSLGGVLYALMANRIQFISLSAGDLSYAPLQTTRAAFCEILAIKMLRTFPSISEEAELVGELVRGWCAFDGASEEVWLSMGDDRSEVAEMRGSALELAIVSESKHFLSLPLIQHLITQIYTGHLVYSPQSTRSLIADSYISERTKQRRRANSPARDPSALSEEELAEVYVYNPYEAGWLDHYRLRVPRWRKYLEFISFAILLGLFVATLASRDFRKVTPIEVVFIVFTLGFTLDEFAASKEHGWTGMERLRYVLCDCYPPLTGCNADLEQIFIFLLYLVIRVFALATRSVNTSDLAFDILAIGACILFPRLVFFVIKDNVVVLALKAMIAEFVGFMGLTIVAFSGICFCLWTLARGTWTVKQIVWLMLQIWFGSSYLGFSSSESFHPVFGPIVLISYAALSNVLLITILISILSNKFAEINANAKEEVRLCLPLALHLFKLTARSASLPTCSGHARGRQIRRALFVLSTDQSVGARHPRSPQLGPVTEDTASRQRLLDPLDTMNDGSTIKSIDPSISRPRPLIAWSTTCNDRVCSSRCPFGLGSSTDLPSSFMGAGSEILIASVFEAAPPAASLKPLSTKPVSAIPTSDSDLVSARSPPSAGGSVFESPLAKLFGKASAVPSLRSKTKRKQAEEKTEGDAGREEEKDVEGLRAELKELRESQLRMEELLNRLLAGK
ncbi:hypothetical protein P7C73_g3457, partial [Tremellales sp. Uapishka_1]